MSLVTRGLSLIVLGTAGLFYLLWELAHRGVYQYATSIYPFDDADEWRYTACSRLLLHGYGLFTEVFSAQPPLLFVGLAGGMRVAGETIQGARSAEIAFGLLGLAASAWLAWQLAGSVASAGAALGLASAPAFLAYSHTVEAEGPMAALVTLSLAVALFARKRGAWPFALLAGLVLAAAILVKLFALAAVLPAVWLLAGGVRPIRASAARLAAFAAGALVPVVADFVLIAPRQQWEQVVVMHQKAADLTYPGIISPLRLFADFGSLNAGLVALAVAAVIVCIAARRMFELGFLVLWVGAQAGMLLLFHPLFPHHLAILTESLAVVAGVGVGISFGSLQNQEWWPSAPVVAGLLLFVAALPRLIHDDRHMLIPGTLPRIQTLASYVARHTTPSDLVAADDLAVADTAGRLVPPPLCDPSNVRLRSGYLSRQEAISATSEYRPVLVVPSSGIYAQIPGYLAWVAHRYPERTGLAGVTVFARR